MGEIRGSGKQEPAGANLLALELVQLSAGAIQPRQRTAPTRSGGIGAKLPPVERGCHHHRCVLRAGWRGVGGDKGLSRPSCVPPSHPQHQVCVWRGRWGWGSKIVKPGRRKEASIVVEVNLRSCCSLSLSYTDLIGDLLVVLLF